MSVAEFILKLLARKGKKFEKWQPGEYDGGIFENQIPRISETASG